MTTPNILPTDWHRRPKGSSRYHPCIICGCPQRNCEHRAVAPEEGMVAKWLWRMKSPTGWQTFSVFEPTMKDSAKKLLNKLEQEKAKLSQEIKAVRVESDRATRRVIRQSRELTKQAAEIERTQQFREQIRSVRCKLKARVAEIRRLKRNAGQPIHGRSPFAMPTPKVAKQMGKLAAELARGKTQRDVAREMGLSEQSLRYWQTRWSSLWIMLLTYARESVLASVGSNADKKAIWRFLEYSETVALEEPSPVQTVALTSESVLPELFENGYVPLRLAGKSFKTVLGYRSAVNAWMRLMGPVPVARIDTRLFAEFQQRILREVGVATANTYCAHLMVLLRFSTDEDIGLLVRPPKWRKLKEPKRVPLALTVEEFAQVLATAQRWPGTIAGWPAPAWWTALLLVCWETGLRYTALLLLRSVDVVWESGGLFCQADTQKDKEAMWFPLPPHVLEAVREIYDPARELLFPRDVTIDCVGRWFRNILNQSGIYAPKGCGQRFHRFRRSKASYTEAMGGNPTRALGHSGRSVTERYFDPRIVRPVAQPLMPSPLCPQTKVVLSGPVALLPAPEPTAPGPAQENDAAA